MTKNRFYCSLYQSISKPYCKVKLIYFSREEITSAMRESVKMVERGEISQQDIDVQLLGKINEGCGEGGA